MSVLDEVKAMQEAEDKKEEIAPTTDVNRV